ncbi:amidohydrolase family protein [Conexibacter sp. CPCC 206217]|uniref:amidohydrolase family protein n=1 Tax=Conexibacter sp. CPCC 206217 TaxID=3064574 RepID=UPI0027222F94|nr:amidohydrolase family protein [Conexibacter sp. CPCC 206217]MDO8211673.1 amidohydrolase family protein [Conexibacter sp. CPCC 206217]
MSAYEIVDFHGHWFPPGVVSRRPAATATPALARRWELLTDLDAQLEAASAAGTDVKVVNAVYSTVAPAAEVPLDELPARVNDALADAVARHDGRLAALATVDAFRGDAGAEEARRAVEQLGLPGIVVDAAQGELLLSAPQARPTLAYCAERGIPVFAHPVNPPQLPQRYADVGGAGVLLARGSESALSTLSLLASGTIAELDGLQLVLAGIAGAALLLANFLDAEDAERPLASTGRSRLTIDTMGFDPAATRFALDLLGPEQVVVGSDWPIMWRDASRERVERMLAQAGADAETSALVAGGNARRLLALRRTRSSAAALR